MKEKNFQILFTNLSPSKLMPEPGQIIISPEEMNWNDYGYKINCRFRALFPKTLRAIEGPIFLSFFYPEKLSSKYDEKKLKQITSLGHLLESKDTPVISPHELPQFYTMQPTLQEYRSIVQSTSKSDASEFFNSINDLAYHKKIKSSWVEKAFELEAFKLAFMRNSESYFAINNAEPIFNGVQRERFDAISNNLNLQFRLGSNSKSLNLHLKYDHNSLIPKRICILIGKNGVGKSLTLKSFVRAMLQYREIELSITDNKGDRPMINRLIAISTPGETKNTFPGERRATQKTYYRRLSMTRSGSRSIGQSLVELTRKESYIGSLRRGDLFYQSLKQASLSPEKIYIRLICGNYAPLSKFVSKNNEKNKLTLWSEISPNSDPVILINDVLHPLSSGQLTFYKFALLSFLHIENGSFVLMDEPETHLHPNMISDFIGLLDYLLEKTGSQALIATHSPYFVREVSRDQVYIYKRNANETEVIKPRIKTFGADVESIAQFVFDEDIENKLIEKIHSKIKYKDFDKYKDELLSEVSLSAYLNLKKRAETE